MQTFLYFAYGSNMLTSRLRRRCPGAVLRTTAMARDHVVTFGKPSGDASGKASLRVASSPGRSTRGAVFEISGDELRALDRAEGGYARQEGFRVECLRSGEILETHTYIATAHDADLRPYDWYLALMLAGIREHGLGDDYEAIFCSVLRESDPETERCSRLEAIEALEEAGFTHLLAPRFKRRS